MLIVKPYGRSAVARGEDGTLRRQLHLRPDDAGPLALPEFAEEHPELVVAQWISAIDRVAAKPRAGDRPTPEQRELRGRLGDAAWSILEKRLPRDRAIGLADLWRRKVHPYGDRNDDRASGREKGRWYARFAGDTAPGDIGKAEAAEIAGKIEEHLYEAEYRSGGGRPDKRKGRIAARAASIAGNVVTTVSEPPKAGWTVADLERYRTAGDVAAKIRGAAEALEKENRRVGPRTAAEALYAHYGKLFAGEDGGTLAVVDASAREPGLFALHMAVREAYTRILKNHKKDRQEHGKRRRKVSALLPGDMNALFRLAGSMGRNRDLNALVRLGKLVHYEAAPAPNAEPAAGDEPVYVVDRWPGGGAVERSRYRTSAGQAEIKRNEAFVRIWRGAGALAQRTLTDWADPDGDIDRDVLGGVEIEKACGAEFNEGTYRTKLPILFGSRAGLFDDAEGPGILRLALEGWAGLRNGSFHFKGRAGFARALRAGLAGGKPSEAVAALLRRDAAGRRARLIASLRAAHAEYCYTQEQLGALFDALAAGAPALSPLPRFRRVLARAENAWRRGTFRLRLPGPENRRDMEANPGRLARYIVLKTLYERAFPRWLEAREAETLNGWIGRAADRATAAAQHINKDKDAAARMAGLVQLSDAERIADFTDRLAAQTAGEYRVQRGYDSDPAAARKQAKHIEDLRCDVVGQAFEAYLADEARKLAWTMDDAPGGPLPEEKKAGLETAAPPAEDAGAEAEEDWLARLYFLLHMVPAEAAGNLRQQLRKWSVLEDAPDGDAAAVERVLGLYLDMHDAKFEGGQRVAGAKALEGLFASPAQFRRACPEGSAGEGGHVPWRGLREMLRFGGGEPSLMRAFRKWPIGAGMVDGLEALEVTVAEAHKQREDLHAKWAGKKGFSCKDKGDYRAALETVVAHRHLAAHVRLVNHARLHRLAMAVLARLADYAGLWERDLYFATLALIRLENGKPEDVFRSKGLERLREGRIVDALKELKKNADGSESAVGTALQGLFGKGFLAGGGAVAVRRDLLHFNMLQHKENKPFDLTAAVNDTRRLMAYDRKLKNAVSRSIIELLAREGLDLAWTMENHELGGAVLRSRQAVHLRDGAIIEDLHGPEFTAMAAALFGGEARPAAGAAEAATGRPDRCGRKGGNAGPRVARPANAPPAPPPRLLPAAGERVKAVLVEEKTKRGGWKAAVDAGGRRIVGDIFNSGEVPPDAGPGSQAELVVRVANPANASFEWPSPDVEARLEKAAAPRRGGRPPGRRR